MYNLDESNGSGDNEDREIEELYEIVLNTREQCEMMDQFIKGQIRIKDEMIDKLYEELEIYKQESADRFVEQFLKAFIKIHKGMKRLCTSSQWLNMSADDVRREFQYVYEDITDLFEQQNMDVYKSNNGDKFNASIHQAKIEYTNDITLDKTIKTSISEGYKRGNKIVIPERVVVYQFNE